MQELITQLSAPDSSTRLAALEKLMALYNSGAIAKPQARGYVNNHIHSIYSFSPYSPCLAAYTAWTSGLTTAGIMDHDSVSGAKEFLKACALIGIAGTVGFECRCSVAGSDFVGKRINNQDQDSVVYLAMHGIPTQNIDRAHEFLTPYRDNRVLRDRKMVDNINGLLAGTGLSLDFDADIVPISMCHEGGSITERHILYALARKMGDSCTRGQGVLDFLTNKLSISVSGWLLEKLLDGGDPMYDYYLLGVLKGHMVEQFYVDATDELPHITEFVALAKELGAVASYPYLGDIGDSVTGDKKTQKFEDDYLDALMAYLDELGFMAVSSMPTRNTLPQLQRLMQLCKKHGFFEISGEDINTPFQSFICEALDRPEFAHLITATWALIGHERAATANIDDGMFTAKTIARMPALDERIKYFSAMAQANK